MYDQESLNFLTMIMNTCIYKQLETVREKVHYKIFCGKTERRSNLNSVVVVKLLPVLTICVILDNSLQLLRFPFFIGKSQCS